MNGDSRADIITGTGPGGRPQVRAFDSATLAAVADFTAYDPAFRGGVAVATAGYNGSAAADILTGPGPGGTPVMKVFGTAGTQLAGFVPFDPAFLGGVFVG